MSAPQTPIEPAAAQKAAAGGVNRKLWCGDVLRLAEGNSFYGFDNVVRHRAGYCTVWRTSEDGDPLVEIDGGSYTVKRADLYELDHAEASKFRAAATIQYAGAIGATREDIENAYSELTGARPLQRRTHGQIVGGPVQRFDYTNERLWFVEYGGHLFASMNHVSDLALCDVELLGARWLETNG